MASIRPSDSTLRVLLTAASLMVIVAGLRAAAAIFIPALLAFFLAILTFPLLFALQRRRVPAGLAIFLSMLAAMGVAGVFVLFVRASINRVVRAAPRYQERFEELGTNALVRLDTMGLGASDWIDQEAFSVAELVNVLGNTAIGVATAVSFFFLVLVIMVFVLAEALGFRRKLWRLLGKDDEIFYRFAKITEEVQRYIWIKTVISLATGLAVGLSVWIIGLDFPFFWGMIAFLLNYIPNFGSVVAGVPAVLLATVQLGLPRALITAAAYVVINLVLGNLVEPALMGRRLRLSPLVVLLSLLFWGWVWGPVGMLLSVPITMVIKIMVENIDSLRWLAVLLDQSPAGTPGPAAPALAGGGGWSGAGVDEEDPPQPEEPDRAAAGGG